MEHFQVLDNIPPNKDFDGQLKKGLKLAVIKDYGDAFKGLRQKQAPEKAIRAAIWQSGHQSVCMVFMVSMVVELMGLDCNLKHFYTPYYLSMHCFMARCSLRQAHAKENVRWCAHF